MTFRHRLTAASPRVAMLGRWCLLAGVLLMVTGDGLTNFRQPEVAEAWPWLYLVPIAAGVGLMAAAGRLGPRRPTAARVLYAPVGMLLGAFAVSAAFSQVPSLSGLALVCVVGIVVFGWATAQLLEDESLAEVTWAVAALALLVLAVQVIAWRLDEGLGVMALHVRTTVWLGKLQIVWVFNLFAPFLFARFIGDRRRLVAFSNGVVWVAVGVANHLLYSRMGSLVFVLTTLAVCLLNLASWRRWLPLMGVAAVGGVVVVASSFEMTSFVASTFVDRIQNRGIGLRLQAWIEAWQLFQAHPIAGIGIGTFDEVTYLVPGTKANPDFHLNGWHAHNVPLHVLTEAGILGLAAWVVLWFTVVRVLARAWKTGDERGRLHASAALVSVLAFQALSMTEVLIGARVHASLRMNLTIALLVVYGLRMAPRAQDAGSIRSSTPLSSSVTT